MAEVRWIKIVTNIFDDQKISYIETLPSGDEIIVIWFKILCLAGKSNANGLLMMTDRIAYTDQMLSSVFKRDIKTIQYALNVFKNLDMIEIIDDKIYILNWEKHQNAEKLELIREQTRLRVSEHRQKRLKCNANSVTEALQVRYGNATEIDIELDKEDTKDIVALPYQEIIEYLNQKAKKKFRVVDKTRKLIQARFSEKFTLEDFKKVIDNQTVKWLNDTKMADYLRPETLFGTKFEGYLNSNGFTPKNGRVELTTEYPTIEADDVDEEALKNAFGNL